MGAEAYRDEAIRAGIEKLSPDVVQASLEVTGIGVCTTEAQSDSMTIGTTGFAVGAFAVPENVRQFYATLHRH